MLWVRTASPASVFPSPFRKSLCGSEFISSTSQRALRTWMTPDHRYHQGHGQTCVGLFLALSKIFIWVSNRAQMPSSVSRTCWGADHSLLSPVPPPLPFLSPFGAFYVASLCLVPSRLVFLTTHLPSTFVPVRIMFFHLFLGPPPFDSLL